MSLGSVLGGTGDDTLNLGASDSSASLGTVTIVGDVSGDGGSSSLGGGNDVIGLRSDVTVMGGVFGDGGVDTVVVSGDRVRIDGDVDGGGESGDALAFRGVTSRVGGGIVGFDRVDAASSASDVTVVGDCIFERGARWFGSDFC